MKLSQEQMRLLNMRCIDLLDIIGNLNTYVILHGKCVKQKNEVLPKKYNQYCIRSISESADKTYYVISIIT